MPTTAFTFKTLCQTDRIVCSSILLFALSSTDQAVAVLVVLVIVGAARPALGSRPAGVEDQQGRHRQPSHILTHNHRPTILNLRPMFDQIFPCCNVVPDSIGKCYANGGDNGNDVSPNISSLVLYYLLLGPGKTCHICRKSCK